MLVNCATFVVTIAYVIQFITVEHIPSYMDNQLGKYFKTVMKYIPEVAR